MNKLHRTIQHNRHRYQHDQMNEKQEEHEARKELTHEEVIALFQSQQKPKNEISIPITSSVDAD